MKIGIFGGCFNPPHNMHEAIGLQLINDGYLDKVIYVPTGNNYSKDYLVPAKDRYNMLKIMISNKKTQELSDYELDELKYTYETLDYFKNKYKDDEIYFICGSDNIKQIHTWKNYKYILDNYKIIVINRNNDININNHKNIIYIKLDTTTLSSTEIRNQIKNKNYELLKQNLNENVLKYILDKKLYQ